MTERERLLGRHSFNFARRKIAKLRLGEITRKLAPGGFAFGLISLAEDPQFPGLGSKESSPTAPSLTIAYFDPLDTLRYSEAPRSNFKEALRTGLAA